MSLSSRWIFICLLCFVFVIGVIYGLWEKNQESNIFPITSISIPSLTLSPTMTTPWHDSEEVKMLKELIAWPEPRGTLSFNSSTSAQNCDYQILNPRAHYSVGETLELLLTARDHQKRPKSYGGDFFRAKLHSPELKAGVTGSMRDHQNGTYTITFRLLWPGDVEVSIRLIHSSEAVQIMKRLRDTRTDKVYFYGYFQKNGTAERTECNLQILERPVCEYTDPRTGEKWVCIRPKQLPCNTLIYHSAGGYRKVTNKEEDALLAGAVTDQAIPGKIPILLVLPGNSSVSLKRIDLHVNYRSGPLLAADVENNFVMHWRAHGNPLRTEKTMVADLHYMANDISAIGGGPDLVIVFTLWAHFTTYPVDWYIRRVQIIRQMVIDLLQRSPQTTVIIKSANTGYKSVYGSDWLSFQLDVILRRMFLGLPVAIVDAWQMTSCHYLPDDIHPGKVVIQNEVDLFLSYICPH
ncbi:NXPE family member 3-like isoform X2 [Rhinatrema bivittatum]|uniref:NXPE family member 3-like isoform X2 n=1 Tax=Rhinatrema bivittatum TaxID=194408 RepID=UPI00112B8E3D|nr:NXPE family member 3-like isoform X2 [Rhinatrema bivittatum]